MIGPRYFCDVVLYDQASAEYFVVDDRGKVVGPANYRATSE